MEDSSPEGEIMSNQAPEGETSTMVVVKWSDELEKSGDNIDSPLCGGLYKELRNPPLPCIIHRTGANIYYLQTLLPYLAI